jgi:hypothetical protein
MHQHHLAKRSPGDYAAAPSAPGEFLDPAKHQTPG